MANQEIKLASTDVRLFVKREDLLHPTISGNKFRKLKYNLEAAKLQGKQTLLTFGGAFSNHIAAVAAAGKEYGFKTIGIIRGEELASQIQNNPTLTFASQNGMRLEFINRQDYRLKSEEAFLDTLESRFGDVFVLPEGGTNTLAVKGCEEILDTQDFEFDYICSAVGTGGTLAGLVNASAQNQKVLGFSALKGDFDSENITRFSTKTNWEIIIDYHFGGYAKVDAALIGFINRFYDENKIQLDPVYTGKMLFGLEDMIAKGRFAPGTKILAIHTGGLQGIAGMNQRLKNKNLHILSHG
ncbi:1-aminocyclopropane-1-carboxylate deaminase/D-cysteine desulfhydrase [Flavobacterium sp. MAH-1]|uniref:1-aminocyclopropane-1-carboxylate deaminase/D-cysteine desulfhydrase n=1 Tax=Flavobacterium agri TaxID=2743471 RepID=A0A7Y8Y3J8_9FLAO|nr:pyridoxal-phosphate dependent enzyme [Flavobacterium agri]NUY81838.1 1-aminocyclopropane-1-carboxylate deaminase/D-cysteine desulfhydrase [Flavobacterium agri]NYA71862.1 1-aminocyclopropane-1-carboxylate deaminase/D-cysteine desulfhydrase [Flavobacterium agri]